MNFTKLAAALAVVAAQLSAGAAQASPFTSTSPFGVDVTSVGATTVGGIVVDLVGLNGAHVVSQLSASSLFNGTYNTTPGTIGSQSGFGAAVTGALGGGLQAAAFRFTLFDGDSAAGDFDFNENTLLINNANFGNWSSVNAQQTDGVGVGGGFSGGGFRDNILDTGWFSTTNSTLLQTFFASLVSTKTIVFKLSDNSVGDNFYDFTRGLNGDVINIGQGPVVTPPAGVPEPASLGLLAIGLAGLAALRKKLAS